MPASSKTRPHAAAKAFVSPGLCADGCRCGDIEDYFESTEVDASTAKLMQETFVLSPCCSVPERDAVSLSQVRGGQDQGESTVVGLVANAGAGAGSGAHALVA